MANNPPAFPGVAHYTGATHSEGMSLRDWFAGQALPSALSALVPRRVTAETTAEQDAEMVARACCFAADAMLAARDAQTQSGPSE